MEATFSSETPVDFQHNIRRYIPEDRTLQAHICLCIPYIFCFNFYLNVFSYKTDVLSFSLYQYESALDLTSGRLVFMIIGQ
jgi:hypothetical protein